MATIGVLVGLFTGLAIEASIVVLLILWFVGAAIMVLNGKFRPKQEMRRRMSYWICTALGMLFAAPIVGLWYWTTDQYIVQRALGAPNEREARRGSIAAAMLNYENSLIY